MHRVQSIGTFLSKRGVSNRSIIVLTDRNVEIIVMFFGVVYKCKTELINGLIERLPKYMMPNKIIRLKKLSLNSHNKVDRVKLKESL